MEFKPVAHIKSIFGEKFGIPRQSGICPSATAVIEFENNRFNDDALADLQGYSHLWVIFYFHSLKKSPDKAKVRPPRLGGNKFVGVFSSRSPYRPNRIGLSLVEVSQIEKTTASINIHICNHDLLDGTPVLDIKPYISHDIPESTPEFGWQSSVWDQLEVEFAPELSAFIEENCELQQIITDVLKNDPRPSYKSKGENEQFYGMNINGHEVNFKIDGKSCRVTKISG